jgi:hypothetical protein
MSQRSNLHPKYAALKMEDTLKTPTVIVGREVSVQELNVSAQPWVGQVLMHAHILGGHSRGAPVELSNISLSCCNQAGKAHRDHWNTRVSALVIREQPG